MKRFDFKTVITILFIFILFIFAFILSVGYVLSNIDPKNKLQGYSIAISFVGIFATFCGAYLGAKISGYYTLESMYKQKILERKDNVKKVVTVIAIHNINLFKMFNSIFERINSNNEEIRKDIENNVKFNEIINKYVKKGTCYNYVFDDQIIEHLDEYIITIKNLSPQFFYFVNEDNEEPNYYLNKLIILNQYLEIFRSNIKIDKSGKNYIHIKDSEDMIFKFFSALLEVDNEIIKNKNLYQSIYVNADDF